MYFTSFALFISLLLATPTLSNHVHRRPLHKHERQTPVVPSATPPETSSVISDIQTLVQDIDKLKTDTLKGCPATYNRLLKIENLLVDIILRTTDATLHTTKPQSPSIKSGQ